MPFLWCSNIWLWWSKWGLLLCWAVCVACIRDLNKDLIETIPPHCTHPELTLAFTGVKHYLLLNWRTDLHPSLRVMHTCCALKWFTLQVKQHTCVSEQHWTQSSDTRGLCSTDACVTGRGSRQQHGITRTRTHGRPWGQRWRSFQCEESQAPDKPWSGPSRVLSEPNRDTDPEPDRGGLGDPELWPAFQGLLAYKHLRTQSAVQWRSRYHSQSQFSGKGEKPPDSPNCHLVHLFLYPTATPHITHRAGLLVPKSSHSEVLRGCVC